MAVDTSNLAVQVQDRIDNLSGSETLDQLLVLRKAADNLGLTLTAIESAIETKLNAFDGATVDEDLLIGNRAASLSSGVSSGGGVPIGGIALLGDFYPNDVTLDGKSYVKSGFFVTEFDSSLDQYAIAGTSYEDATANVGTTDMRGCALDGTNAIAVGFDGTVIYSTDAGQTWSDATANVGTTDMYGCAIDGTNAIAVGLDGTVIYSTDAGQAWSDATANVGTTDMRGCALDGTNAIAVGFDGTVIYSTAIIGITGYDPIYFLRYA